MPLIDAWENDFFEEFTKLNLDNIGDYVRKNRKELIFLCESIEGLDKKIEEMLGEFIIKKARENYYPKLFRGCSQDSLPHPEYLAYALRENAFSSDELRKINLGNDSWRDDFIKKYSKENLLRNFREKLFF